VVFYLKIVLRMIDAPGTSSRIERDVAKSSVDRVDAFLAALVIEALTCFPLSKWAVGPADGQDSAEVSQGTGAVFFIPDTPEFEPDAGHAIFCGLQEDGSQISPSQK